MSHLGLCPLSKSVKLSRNIKTELFFNDSQKCSSIKHVSGKLTSHIMNEVIISFKKANLTIHFMNYFVHVLKNRQRGFVRELRDLTLA